MRFDLAIPEAQHAVGLGLVTLISVDAPHFNAGLIVDRGYVVDAAPILRWAIGKPWDEVKAYFAGKRWTWESCPDAT